MKKVLLTPGPIEISETVRKSMTITSTSHLDKNFINIFQRVLFNTKKLFNSNNGTPLIISGSGTLGWDSFCSNIINKNDNILLLSTGFFSQSFNKCLTNYGANVNVIKPISYRKPISIDSIKNEILKKKNYKAIVITHVDTSTGVCLDIEKISKLIKEIIPETFIIVDGVCSIGCEFFKFDDWGIDYCLTASQKAIGAPPGLSISMISKRLLNYSLNNDTQVRIPNFNYISWKNWIPIMESYMIGKPLYFATPPIQLINSLDTALQELLIDLDKKIDLNKQTSLWFKNKIINNLNLSLINENKDTFANGLTTFCIDNPTDLIQYFANNNITIAGPILKDLPPHVRIGHMGITAWDSNNNDYLKNCYKLLEIYVSGTNDKPETPI